MKRIFNISLAAFALVAIFMSCNKEVGNPDEILNPDKQKEQVNPAAKTITITATLSDATTKVSFDPVFGGTDGHKPTSMAHTWQEGDKLRVTDESDSSVSAEFDLISGEGTDTGVFQGTIAVATSYSVEVIPAGTPSEGNIQTQAKDGDTAHLKYVAGATGVTNLKNFTLTETSAIIGIIAKLPTDVAVTVDKLEIEKSTDDFVTSEKLTINLTNSEDVNNDDVLEVYANIPTGWTIAAGTKMFLRFGSKNANHTVYTRYQEFADAPTITAGAFNYIKMNCAHIDQYAGKDDAGSSTAPYLIADKYQMNAMHDLLGAATASSTTYFKLIDNIDLSSFANWVPIDASSKFIHLEGNNKTISNLKFTSGDDYYPGLFGILYGTVRNLTISSANISGGNKGAGILAGYLCSSNGYGIGCTIDHVTIDNSTINGNGKVCGALAGSIGQNNTKTFAINISNVTVSNSSVSTTNDCGGLIALAQGVSSANRTLLVSNCDIINSTVSSTGTGIRVGGLFGFIPSANTTISDIVVKGTNVSGLSKAKAVGGIVGLVSSAADFDRCTYQNNGETTATVTGPTQHDGEANTAGAYVGGIAGEVSGDATFDDCHVKNATVTFTNPTQNASYWKLTGGAFGFIHSSGAKIGNTTACTVETVSVPAYHYCGGFVGEMNQGSVENSTVTGLTISGRNYVGGFVGQIDAGSISSCSVAGNTITSANATVGGFAGMINAGSLEICSTSLNVGDDSHMMATNIGGFAGQVQGGTLEDCHASGNVYASGDCDGGFVGLGSAGSFTNCSSSGTIKGSKYVAGFIGKAENGLFTGCSYIGTSITATGSDKNGHVGGFVGRAHTVASSFTNCHVGGNTSLTISSSAAQRCGGFIGQLDGLSPATAFSKCYVRNVNISGPTNTGGFVGVQYGPIDKCWVEGGSVTSVGGGNTGGFSAFIQNSGATANLTNCYTTANVDGASYNTVGGLVGIANNSAYSIQYCYSTGTVSGTGSNKGGFIGSVAGSSVTIDKCVSWNSSLALIGTDSGGTVTNNYVKTAAETGTVSSHAQESPRSWSSTTWDFTGDLPTLK